MRLCSHEATGRGIGALRCGALYLLCLHSARQGFYIALEVWRRVPIAQRVAHATARSPANTKSIQELSSLLKFKPCNCYAFQPYAETREREVGGLGSGLYQRARRRPALQ